MKSFSGPACKQMKELDQNIMLLTWLPFEQMIQNMLGESDDPCVLSGNAMKEDEFQKTVTDQKHLVALAKMHMMQLEARYLFHNLESAAELIGGFALPGDKAFPGFFGTVRAALFEGLTCFGMSIGASKSRESKKWHQKGLTHFKRMKAWVSAGNINCVHYLGLLEAEQAVSKGKLDLAKEKYNDSISIAKRNGFVQDAALAHERAGIFFLAQDDTPWAKYHVEKSILFYKDWGCTAKVDHLSTKYEDLLSS